MFGAYQKDRYEEVAHGQKWSTTRYNSRIWSNLCGQGESLDYMETDLYVINS